MMKYTAVVYVEGPYSCVARASSMRRRLPREQGLPEPRSLQLSGGGYTCTSKRCPQRIGVLHVCSSRHYMVADTILRRPSTQHVSILIHEAQQKYKGTVASYGNVSNRRQDISLRDIQGAPWTVPPDVVAFAMELMTTPASGQALAPAGQGSKWFGVDTLQDPMDAAAISALIWELQPDLVIEIGTECGGSAIFCAQMLKLMRLPRKAKLITYDVLPTRKRRCYGHHPGYKSSMWRDLVANGFLEPRIANVTAPSELRLIAAAASAAKTVMIIDDGDHFATPLILHFELLARFVTPGSVYLVQDTRLDRMCLAQKQYGKRGMWRYCAEILQGEGGPARAVRYLQCESASFRRLGFSVDRSLEKWIFTQHPGGFLRRANNN
eukprot:6188585-Pleurochrysis_carterae.AAC.4